MVFVATDGEEANARGGEEAREGEVGRKPPR